MILFIDTSNSEKITIGINDVLTSTDARIEKSQMLLRFIMEKLKEKGKTLHDIKEIEINEGPGSFTGLRVGFAVANTLSSILGVRVNGHDFTYSGPFQPKYY